MCDCTCTTCLDCDADFEDEYEPLSAVGYAFGSPGHLAALGAEIERMCALATPPGQIPPAFRRSSTPLIDSRPIIDYADQSIRA